MSPEAKTTSSVIFSRSENGQIIGRFAALKKIDGLKHFFTTAEGPVGNLSSTIGDHHNTRTKLAEMLGVQKIFSPQQIHSNRIITTDDFRSCQDHPQADGVITNEKSSALLCISADCPVVLLADTQSSAIAAVHSGWRGTKENIVGEAISKLAENYGSEAKAIVAAIAPCAGQCCYEVGGDVFSAFENLVPRAVLNECFNKTENNNDKYMLNLGGIIISQLTQAGVKAHNIHSSDICTICDDRFHSFRRCGNNAGRCGSVIAR